MDFEREVNEAVSLRRYLHEHPEPGFQEVETQAKLWSIFTELGAVESGDDPSSITLKKCAGTGIILDIPGTGSSEANTEVKVIALRADMDALRMTEANENLPYHSSNKGVAHMCGHDGHMASMVLAVKLIIARREAMPRNTKIRVLFQPAEEGPGGALPMLQEGCLEGVDEVYGYHNWPTMPLGGLRVKAGALMAHVSEFRINIIGKGAHGSQPHASVDPVLVGAHIVTALQSIVSRSLPSASNAVVSVTMFHAGEVRNVIPETAEICGTIRDLDPKVFETVSDRFRAIVTNTCAAFGARVEVELESMYPVVDNHPLQTDFVKEVGREVLGADSVNDADLPMLGAEDFSYFMMPEHGGKPGCFFFLGGGQEDVCELAEIDMSQPGAFAMKKRTNCICHGVTFDFNDNLLPLAGILWVRIVEHRLNVHLYSKVELDSESWKQRVVAPKE